LHGSDVGTACIVGSMKQYGVHAYRPTGANMQQQVCCCGPDRQEILIDCCSSSVRQANAGIATLLAYVGG